MSGRPGSPSSGPRTGIGSGVGFYFLHCELPLAILDQPLPHHLHSRTCFRSVHAKVGLGPEGADPPCLSPTCLYLPLKWAWQWQFLACMGIALQLACLGFFDRHFFLIQCDFQVALPPTAGASSRGSCKRGFHAPGLVYDYDQVLSLRQLQENT
jgi:hypothetical protein